VLPPQGHLGEKVLQRSTLSRSTRAHERDAPLPRQWTLTELNMASEQEQFIGRWDNIPEPVIANEVPFNSAVGYMAP